MILDCALDALKDGALSIPILFIAYLLMELLERSKKLDESILHAYSAKAGPLVGGLLGVVPQCGISGAAATLFSTGSITVGTMLAVFFATSDEMLPVMLSSMTESGGIRIGQILTILAAKAGLGIVLGYLADFFGRRFFSRDKDIHSFCEREHCECEEEEGSALHAALVHTVKIAGMLIAVTFVLNLVLANVSPERLSSTLLARPVIGEILLAGYAGEAEGGRCVPDLVPHRGPLSGIHACLSAAKGAACLVLSVDAPLVPLAALFALMEGYRPPITVLEHGGRWEPLIGVYDRALAPLCGELLAGERSSVMRLFDAAGCESVHWEGEELLLCNCNTPEEYQRLLARAAGAGKGREEA